MDSLINTVVGNCLVQSCIGQGGMGAVYLAHHQGLDIPVALKILNPLDSIEYARERFVREARAAAKLRHPNIVGVLDVGCEKGLDFIVMEYVEGRNLYSEMKEKGVFAVSRAGQIMIQLLDALEAVAERGIVHRDIKPENILLDDKGNVKLADLGLARIDGDLSLTRSSTVLGSPYYVAPEQAQDPGNADVRADIYSLGCTFFQMLTGRAPYQGSSVMDVVLGHLNKPIPKVNEFNAEVSRELSSVIGKMMQKDPKDRFQTPKEVRHALEKVLGVTGMASQNVSGKPKHLSAVVVAVSVTVLIIIGGFYLNRMRNRPDEVAGVVPKSETLNPDRVQKPQAHSYCPEMKKTSDDQLTIIDEKQKPQKKDGEESETELPELEDGPVLRAVKAGDSEALSRLLDKGVNPSGRPGNRTSPLHEAVKRGSIRDVEFLLSKGANPSAVDYRGNAPLHYALKNNQILIVTKLLEKGANPNMKDSRGRTPLQIARSVDSELERLVKAKGGN